ncbi:ABC transporter substrate-binding protein [Microbacterium alcoholitolerans]|uniref:ABC transporter substrate-binding protein n=1 Tax=unclassified Microbacterium TaxID=2609290 RepID=UPI003D1865CE
MKRRHLIPAAALAVGALALSACAPSSSSNGDTPQDPTGEEITLEVWSWRTEDVAAYNRIFDVFTAAHPGIKVQFEAFQNTEYNQLLATGLAASDGPDIAQVRSYGQLQANVEAGQLEQIDSTVSGLDQFPAHVIDSSKGTDGGIYSVPLATQTFQVYYNKAIFAEHDLEVPTTWDQFLDVQETLLDAGITPLAVGAKDDWVLPLIHDTFGSSRYGGSEFREKVLSGETDFTDADYVASLQVLDDLAKYMPEQITGVGVVEAQMLFTSGQAAQYPGGSFDLAALRDLAPDLDLGTFPVPAPPGSVQNAPSVPSWADGNFAISANSPHKEAAATLLSWMTTAEFGQLVADELNMFSAIPGVTYSDPVMAETWADYEAGGQPYILLIDFRFGDPFGTAVLGVEVQRMFLGEQDAAGAAAALQDGVAAWFTPGQ